MPVVTIEMWEGRTPEQKRKLVKTVKSDVAKAIGCLEEPVVVVEVRWKGTVLNQSSWSNCSPLRG
jgi:4-oxalocrotonate tautomerase family enzyme